MPIISTTLYARYDSDPQAVDAQWQAFFASLRDNEWDVARNARGAVLATAGLAAGCRTEISSPLSTATGPALEQEPRRQAACRGAGQRSPRFPRGPCSRRRAIRCARSMLIRAYRMRGHLHANLDPLGLEPERDPEELDPRSYGFDATRISTGRYFSITMLGLEFGTLHQIVAMLRRTYCQTLGVEFMHISDPQQKGWIQERIEGPDKEITFTREGKRAILNKLVEAEGFEKFCDVKFTGTKRFGLDGAELMIPALEQIIKRGGALGVKDIALGMAHRGRLNVLAHVLAKPHRAIFHEFKGGSSSPDDVDGSGDVKYHLGASSDREFDNNRVHLSLTANPSHLEIVNPVVLGKTRAKQDQLGATPEDRTCAHAASDFRRRGLRRPGRHGRMFRTVRAARPSHRRLGAFHRQQPDRLYHLSALQPLLALSVRRRQDDRGADFSRQWRRSRGRGVRRQDRDRVPPEIPEARRHRHVLLSPPRPQRGRRADVHPAADVQGDPVASDDAGNLCASG